MFAASERCQEQKFALGERVMRQKRTYARRRGLDSALVVVIRGLVNE